MDIIKSNIENLTSLWRLAGTKANAFHHEKEFSYVPISYSEWPNRLWFHDQITQTNLEPARDILSQSPIDLKITCWDVLQPNASDLLENSGFIESSEQIGMSMKLNERYNSENRIILQRVEDKDNAILWSKLFQRAFSYQISPALVLLSCTDIDYFIAYHKNQYVGTCILYSNASDIVGIHSLGIIPEMRRKGYAEEIMRQVLNQSIEDGFKYTTLQASAMARPMYEKLGFAKNFIMKNYQLKK